MLCIIKLSNSSVGCKKYSKLCVSCVTAREMPAYNFLTPNQDEPAAEIKMNSLYVGLIPMLHETRSQIIEL